MAFYPMKKKSLRQGSYYSATIDCDTENGPIYRASSTCSVAFMALKNKAYIYGSFIINDNVNNEVFIKESEVANLWEGVSIK
jgi:hypothetical protein